METQPRRPASRQTDTRGWSRGVPRGWRIVRYEASEPGPGGRGEPRARWAVEHRGRRVAWGLRDVSAAQRWLARLTAPVQLKLENPQPTDRPVVAAGTRTRGRPERRSSVLRAYDRAPYWTA